MRDLRAIARSCLAGAAAAATILSASANLSLAQPPGGILSHGDILVSDEGPFCSVRGIWYVHDGQAHVLAWGAPLELPKGLVQQSDGSLIVADGLAGIGRYTLATGAFAVIKANPPANPRSVAAAPDGSLVIADWTTVPNAPGTIYRLTSDGGLHTIARGGPVAKPHSVTVAPDGSIVVADVHSGILRIATDGTVSVIHPVDAELEAPSAVTTSADGTIYAADILGAAVLRIAPSGQTTVLHRGAPLQRGIQFPVGVVGGPRGITLDNDGNPLVLDEKAKAIFRISSRGDLSQVADLSALCSPAELLMYRGPTIALPDAGTPAPQTPVDPSLLSSPAAHSPSAAAVSRASIPRPAGWPFAGAGLAALLIALGIWRVRRS